MEISVHINNNTCCFGYVVTGVHFTLLAKYIVPDIVLLLLALILNIAYEFSTFCIRFHCC